MVKKGEADKIEVKKSLLENVPAPVKKGDKVGELVYMLGGKEIGRQDIVAKADVNKIKIYMMYIKMLKNWLFM